MTWSMSAISSASSASAPGVAAGNEQDYGLALAEGVVYELGVRAVADAGVGGAHTVEEVRAALAEVAGHDDQQHEYERRDADLDEDAAHLPELGMMRLWRVLSMSFMPESESAGRNTMTLM